MSVVTRTRSFFRADANLLEQVVYLAFDGADFDFRIDQARGTNYLLHKNAAGFGEFVRARSGGDVDDLIGAVFKLFKSQRAIIQCGRHAKTIIDQRFLARRMIAVIPCHDLWEWSGAIRRQKADSPAEHNRAMLAGPLLEGVR